MIENACQAFLVNNFGKASPETVEIAEIAFNAGAQAVFRVMDYIRPITGFETITKELMPIGGTAIGFDGMLLCLKRAAATERGRELLRELRALTAEELDGGGE